MEDLHVHEVQQGMKVSKESSSATLGAMLPQVPPDKTIIKKKEGKRFIEKKEGKIHKTTGEYGDTVRKRSRCDGRSYEAA